MPLACPWSPVGSNVGGSCAYYQPNAKDAALGLMVVDNHIIRIDVWEGSSLKTASGIQLGSTEAEVLAVYPDYIETAPTPIRGARC
jgi:hypothetical protein